MVVRLFVMYNLVPVDCDAVGDHHDALLFYEKGLRRRGIGTAGVKLRHQKIEKKRETSIHV